MRGVGRERGRGRLSTEQGAGWGTWSQDPEIMTSAKGGCPTDWATHALLLFIFQGWKLLIFQTRHIINFTLKMVQNTSCRTIEMGSVGQIPSIAASFWPLIHSVDSSLFLSRVSECRGTEQMSTEYMSECMRKSTLVPSSSLWEMSMVPGASTCLIDPNLSAVTSWRFFSFLSRRGTAESMEGRGLLQTLHPLQFGGHQARLQSSCVLSDGSKVHLTVLHCFLETWNFHLLEETFFKSPYCKILSGFPFTKTNGPQLAQTLQQAIMPHQSGFPLAGNIHHSEMPVTTHSDRCTTAKRSKVLQLLQGSSSLGNINTAPELNLGSVRLPRWDIHLATTEQYLSWQKRHLKLILK